MGFLRVQAAMARAGIEKPDGPIDDEKITITCPKCHALQTLGQTPVNSDGDHTFYRCKNGCQRLVIVTELLMIRTKPCLPGPGYRLGGYLIRNAADLFLPV